MIACLVQYSKKGAEYNAGKYKDYKTKQTVKQVQLVDAEYHSTLCSVCQFICHDRCNLKETATDPGTESASLTLAHQRDG